MSVTVSPSDFTEINPSYSDGRGFYTNATEVANLLQVPVFTASTTYPTLAQVGAIIKRVEGLIDDKVKRSFRPIITKNEFHDFQFKTLPMHSYYGGYVGFIQLSQLRLRKVISLQVWQGSEYEELASAQAKILLQENFRDLNSIILELPNSGDSFEMVAENDISGLGNDEFCNTFGIKTTNDEIVSLVNEQFPSSTSNFTGATALKSLSSTPNSLSISDFFYAAKDRADGKRVLISSLLSGDDGAECVIKATIKQSCSGNNSVNLTVADSSKLAVGMTVSGISNIVSGSTITSITDSTTVVLSNATTSGSFSSSNLTFTTDDKIPTVCDLTNFTDKEDLRRLGSYWTIKSEGRIFFLRDYPYHEKNSVIVTYLAGNGRVPAAIHEAATKLAAAEILRHDDQSVLIAETGANITTKEKYDILKKEAMDILKGKGDLVYFLG
tara:strand:- start:286 stop:1605 length:1320 start_codon:yes stop_codon:yes gene_type:complete